MKHIYRLLAQMIEEGRVVVDIPAVDMESLAQLCTEHDGDLLECVRSVVYDKDYTPEKKLEILQEVLEDEEA